jgi:hypothetical protein
LKVVYGGRSVGAAGIGWDVPLSYVRRDITLSHRLPTLDVAGVPVGREMVTLVIEGQSHQMMRKGDQRTSTVWVPIHDGPQLELRDLNGLMVLYDGEGRKYSFSPEGGAAGSRLDGGNLYLLKDIFGPGKDSVHLEYSISTPTLPGGGNGLTIDLARVRYNQNAVNASCFKTEAILNYNLPANSPLSMTMLGQQILVRMDTLSSIDIHSRADDCTTPDIVLRSYAFNYPTVDPDTQLPLLGSVNVRGRAGTPEASKLISLGTYSYGSATVPGDGNAPTLHYALRQQIPKDLNVATIGRTLGFQADNANGTNTWDALIDMTGDGRPDLIYQRLASRGGAQDTRLQPRGKLGASVAAALGNRGAEGSLLFVGWLQVG